MTLPPLRFGNDTINPFDSARNIGAIFDSTMSMLSHVNLVRKSAFYHLRYIFLIKSSYLQRLAKFSSMLLYPLTLNAATRFCIMCRNMV